ncbi:S9 family peptidase OS=Streptomyces tendae OX=1932 GN=GUR47_15250 PE=4 SV=1 [Streptomyces tendae]
MVVADGRGTPGRSPAWEKAVKDDLAAVVLQDQVDTLHALAADFPLDLDRVAIRGWSFRGSLQPAALRRLDVFHAAVVGAPVADLGFFDAAAQERCLRPPGEQRVVYGRGLRGSSAGWSAVERGRQGRRGHPRAGGRQRGGRPLAAPVLGPARGRPAARGAAPVRRHAHDPQESVAENLLRLQVDLLKRSLPAPA